MSSSYSAFGHIMDKNETMQPQEPRNPIRMSFSPFYEVHVNNGLGRRVVSVSVLSHKHGKGRYSVPTQNYESLHFEATARQAFSFLSDLGFSEVESSPTVVRFRKDAIEVEICHGLQSYEIGVGISRLGVRYGLSAIIRTHDPDAADRYRYAAATTAQAVATGLGQVSVFVKALWPSSARW